MKPWIVVPAYNEERTLGGVLSGLRAHGYAVIVVDDGSTDATAAVARAAGALVLRHVINRGQGAALKTGIVAALARGADAIVHFDADGQHDPATVSALLAPLERGEAEVVYGSRFLGIAAEGMPAARRMLLALARHFNALVLGIPHRITDPQSGMRAMTAEAVRRIEFRQDRMAHCSEILRLVSRSSFRVCEVPVRVIYTRASLKKGQKVADAFRIVWQLFLGAFH
jgi:glycosyltransferase involved in cell wall biosynthesis